MDKMNKRYHSENNRYELIIDYYELNNNKKEADRFITEYFREKNFDKRIRLLEFHEKRQMGKSLDDK